MVRSSFRDGRNQKRNEKHKTKNAEASDDFIVKDAATKNDFRGLALLEGSVEVVKHTSDQSNRGNAKAG